MKNLIYILVYFSPLISNLFAQEIDLNWAPDLIKENVVQDDYRPFHLDDDAYYILASKRKESSILKFDLNHNYLSETVFSDFQGKQHITPQNKIRTKNFTYAYSILGDAKADVSSIYTSQLQQDGFEKLNAKFRHPLNIGATCLFNLDLVLSPDSALIAYVNDQGKNKIGESKNISVAVFNERFGTLWKKEFELDVPGSKFEQLQTIVGNDGVIYILARNFVPIKERKNRVLPFEYVIYRLHHTGIQSKTVELNDKNILLDIRISLLSESGGLSIVGTYSDKSEREGIHGLFYTSGNLIKGFTDMAYSKFERELLEWYSTPEQVSKGSGLPLTFVIKEGRRHPNGDLSLVLEDSFEVVDEEDDDDIIYHSYDILVARFSNTGTLKNIAHLPKYFFGGGLRSSTSYSLSMNQDEIYILYNHTKRKGEFEEGEDKCFFCTYTEIVVINQNGRVASGTELIVSKVKDGRIHPLQSAVNNNAFLIVSKNVKNVTMGTIRLEN